MKKQLFTTNKKQIDYQFILNRSFYLLAFLLALSIYVYSFIPFFKNFGHFGYDWMIFKTAIKLMFSGQNPYTVSGYFSPPWMLLILSPITILPTPFDTITLVILSTISFIVVVKKFSNSWLLVILFMLTPQLWWGILYGNVDFLVALGIIMPPQFGLFFILVKPQIGIAIAIFWLIQAWRKGKLKEVIRIFAPISTVVVLSIFIFGLWFTKSKYATDLSWNIANWPLLLPIGIVLLYRSIELKKFNLAVISAPFLSPYIAVQSLPIAVIGLLGNKVEATLAMASMWITWLLRKNL